MRTVPLGLHEGDREQLMAWARASTIRAGFARRARIVLLAAAGISHTEIAERMGVSRQTVVTWRGRHERSGLAGLADQPRSGRPRRVDRPATALFAALEIATGTVTAACKPRHRHQEFLARTSPPPRPPG